MPVVCDICVEVIEDGEDSVECIYEPYDEQELEIIFGSNFGFGADAFKCGTFTHRACIDMAKGPRTCCETPALRADRCLMHNSFEGFLCYDCNRWHNAKCAGQGILEVYGRHSGGLCHKCLRVQRVDAAVNELKAAPTTLLEALAEVVRGANEDETDHLTELAELVRAFRAVRVPNARTPTVSLELMTAAARRIVAASSALQSGLEREFLELLNSVGLAHEFHVQRPIPIDVAALSGNGRRSCVTTPDFVHASLPYVIYLDGRTAHKTEGHLLRDSEITAELTRMGFLVRRLRTQQLSPDFRRQTEQTVLRDLDQLRSKAVKRGLLA